MPGRQVQRRLTAIVAADVAGYSRLVALDEEGALRQLGDHLRQVVEPTVAAQGGRIFKTTGDGFLAEFPGSVDAVRCAVAIQDGIAQRNAPGVPANRWFAMTKLDENRAKTQLAKKAGVDITEVSNLAIWGNHSSTMYPDFYNAKIGGKAATDVIKDDAWFKDAFIPTVQQRGAAIIKARGLSSAASAANAVVDTVRSLTAATPAGDCTSVAVVSDGSYGIEKGLLFSYPIRSHGNGQWEIIQGVPVNDFSRSKIAATEDELKEEKSLVGELLPA